VSVLFAEREHRVSNVELFFDLVFVFAFTQVTTLWLDEPAWGGLGRGLLVLAALWWIWAGCAWLTNAADAEAGFVSTALLSMTAGLFVAALAVPGAFSTERTVFGVAFFAVVVSFVWLYAVVSRASPDLLEAVRRTAWITLPGAALILGAAFVPANARPALWGVALIIGFVGPALVGSRGWRVEPEHFAERHGLIVIIAIGESLGAIGFGARGTHLGGDVIVATLLGLLVAVSFWLAYFDFASSGLRDLLVRRQGVERAAIARDVYTYLHLPLVAGIVLFAFGMRSVLKSVNTDLRWVPAVALCCGCALYLLAFVGIRWRVARQIGGGRPAAALALALLTLAATHVHALVELALVCAVLIGLHAYELIRWRDERARRRAQTRDAVAAG
jgi:low temperature requirement protein LtrA